MLGKQATTVLAVAGAKCLVLVDGDRLVHVSAPAHGKPPVMEALEIPPGHGKVVKGDLSIGVAIAMEDGACFYLFNKKFHKFVDAVTVRAFCDARSGAKS